MGTAGCGPTAASPRKVTNGSEKFGTTTRLSSIKPDAQMVVLPTPLETLEPTTPETHNFAFH